MRSLSVGPPHLLVKYPRLTYIYKSMELLHHELRRARERAGLSQQALARLAGIPRNQIARAERGENITIETLRKIATFLPVTDLTLIDTKGLRVDVIPEPEKLFIGALENVMRLADALQRAIEHALDARDAVIVASRTAPPIQLDVPRHGQVDPILLLRRLHAITEEIQAAKAEARIAS